ncbi:F-type H+-transporting ATPase subunit b [Mytilus galloprovincialis]|uniref:ATP synthase subunit b n=1 Tax=Mytilus galloprovincialis TaxID=29158 RepID=A0A8B6F178_MYTGA|nr:F-type H+-transporting ATPase subunit b [Mytilus galloprovincialis]
MLSRLALKSGSVGRFCGLQRCLPQITARPSSSTPAVGGDKPLPVLPQHQAMIEDMVRWTQANEVFYGKDRDTVNFPILKMSPEKPKMRFLVIPQEWFDALYTRTGVTGPYLLTYGLAATLVSKEIFIVDHVFADLMMLTPPVLLATYFWGPKVGTWFQKRIDVKNNLIYEKPIADTKASCTKQMAKLETAKEALDATKDFVHAQKEYVLLQLEASYRERLNKVYTEVKKRLDFKMEVQNAQRRFEQEHMVNWITSNVVKSITPKEEEKSIADCIATLKKISQVQSATA